MVLNNVNPNGNKVVANNLSNVKKNCFLKIMKIEFRNKHHILILGVDQH
jgi:hypothetical protein